MKRNVLFSTLLTAGLMTGPVFAAGAEEGAAAEQTQPDTAAQAAEQVPGTTGAADTAVIDASGDAELAEALMDNPEAVRLVQQALIMHGYDLQADGQWSETTKQAVQDFQETSGIEGEGLPTMATLQQLGLEIRPVDDVPQAAERPMEEPAAGEEETGAGAMDGGEAQDAPQTD